MFMVTPHLSPCAPLTNLGGTERENNGAGAPRRGRNTLALGNPVLECSICEHSVLYISYRPNARGTSAFFFTKPTPSTIPPAAYLHISCGNPPLRTHACAHRAHDSPSSLPLSSISAASPWPGTPSHSLARGTPRTVHDGTGFLASHFPAIFWGTCVDGSVRRGLRAGERVKTPWLF